MQMNLDPGKTLHEFLHLVLNFALVKVNATAGSIMMLDESGSELHIKARLGPPRQRRTDEPIFEVNGEGIASCVVREKRAHNSPNVESDTLFKTTQSGSPHFTSLLCVPIEEKARVTGKMPQRANSARPRNPVIGIGMGSVIHQRTTQVKTPKVSIPVEVTSGRGGRKAMITKASGPRNRPTLRRISSKRTSAGVSCFLTSEKSCHPIAAQW